MFKKKQPIKALPLADKPTWCPGCGDFGIWEAFRRAAAKNNYTNENTVIVAGIGCHGHIVNFLEFSAFEGLHGRALPVAEGIKIANPDLSVFVFTGDGDSLAEGGNHLIHASRRNHNLAVILHDNAIYGLTTGQASPRTNKHQKTRSTPTGNPTDPIQPLKLALAAGATWLARVYSGHIDRVAELMELARRHEGFAVLQVLQPCVTFNQENTHDFYQRSVYELPADYDRKDEFLAYRTIGRWGDGSIPVGIFYENKKPAYESLIRSSKSSQSGRATAYRSISSRLS